MTRLLRHDIGELEPPRRVGGRVIADARIARTGIQTYTLPDGTVRREYGPPEEVFKADTLGSALLAPVTVNHPAAGLLTEATAREHQRGAVGEARRDGAFVRAPLGITDAEAAKAASTTHRQISCGYECRVDETPGVTPEGEHYDAIQRDIVINHVALVEAGRAGPAVRVRMDSESAMMTPAAPAAEERKAMDKVDIKLDWKGTNTSGALPDRVTVPAEVATAIEAMQRLLTAKCDEADKARADAAKAQARLDAANDPAAKAKEREEIISTERARQTLLTKALPHLDVADGAVKIGETSVKLDALTPRQIQEAALARMGVKLDAEKTKPGAYGDAYVAARFDAALEQAGASTQAVDGARSSGNASAAPAPRLDANSAREAAMKQTAGAWQPKN